MTDLIKAADALAEAVNEQLAYMDMCGDKGDLERNMRSALTAYRQARESAGGVKLRWDEHPDGEGFYAFANDAGDCLYAITNDVMPGNRWRMFIGAEVVKDPDGDDFSIMVWDDPEPAKAFAQQDLESRLLSATAKG